MARQINLYEAKTQLSRLVEDAANGETIIIAKDGKPMAKLSPVTGTETPRRLGQLSEHASGIDWVVWWRNWKAADKQIEAEFDKAIAKPSIAVHQPHSRKRRH
jgi:antitoxin (DNA-binding transcriptional repressor) of toxin-antitoxin stability system